MFEVLIREAAARFGVGDKALPLMQMLLAAMTAKDTGGLVGFLEKFKAAGLGPLAQSWLGGGANAQPIGNAQVEAVLGTGGGLLPVLATHLNLPRDKVTEAIGYLLPALVGRLTPGGTLPANPSAEIASYAQSGQELLAQAAQAMQAAQRIGAAGARKGLPWVLVLIIVLAALLYFWNASQYKTPPKPVPLPIPGTALQSAPPPAEPPRPLPGATVSDGSAPPPRPASAASPATPAASAAN